MSATAEHATPHDDELREEYLACYDCNELVCAGQVPGWEPGWASEPGLLRCPGDTPCSICEQPPANGVNYPITSLT